MNFLGKNLEYYIRNNKSKAVTGFWEEKNKILDSLEVNLEKLSQKKICFIGFQHGGDINIGDTEKQNLLAIKSQNNTYKLLFSINPDLVGVEGFCGDIYTPRMQTIEHFHAVGEMNPNNLQIFRGITQLAQNNSCNSVYRYWQLCNIQKRNCTFVGIENKTLDYLAAEIHNKTKAAIESRDMIKFQEIKPVNDDVSFLRGYSMFGTFNQRIEIHRSENPVLPIGAEHIREELAKIQKIHSPIEWKIEFTAEKPKA